MQLGQFSAGGRTELLRRWFAACLPLVLIDCSPKIPTFRLLPRDSDLNNSYSFWSSRMELRTTSLLSQACRICQCMFHDIWLSSEYLTGELSCRSCHPWGWPGLALARCPSRSQAPLFTLCATRMSFSGLAVTRGQWAIEACLPVTFLTLDPLKNHKNSQTPLWPYISLPS